MNTTVAESKLKDITVVMYCILVIPEYTMYLNQVYLMHNFSVLSVNIKKNIPIDVIHICCPHYRLYMSLMIGQIGSAHV